MDANRVREHLHEYQLFDSKIKRLEDAISQIKEDCECCAVKAQVITDMPRSQAGTESKIANAIANAAYTLQKKEEELLSLRMLRIAITDVLSSLNNNHHEIIYMRYIDIPQGRPKWRWPEIAHKTHYSIIGLKNIDQNVILKIQKKYIDSFKAK